MSDIDFAELDGIAAEAAVDEQAAEQAAGLPPGAPVPVPVDPAQEWGDLLSLGASIVSMALPALAKVYTPEACLNWGSKMAVVADKYGWSVSSVMGRFGPEIALAIATFPLARDSWLVYQAAKAETDRAIAQAKAVAGQTVEQRNVKPISAEDSVSPGVAGQAIEAVLNG